MKSDRYRILPQHSATERNAIFESIQAEGLKTPLIIDEFDRIIDGHLRRDICEELKIDWHVGAIVRVGLTDDEKKSMAVTINLARRSTPPTTKQRREYAETMLMAYPEQSDACIAAVVGLDGTTVCKYRKQLLKDQKIKPVTHTVGKDGRRRKVSSEKRKVSNPKRASSVCPKGETLPLTATAMNKAPKAANGIVCVPLSFRPLGNISGQASAVAKVPRDAEPPTHEHESVLRLLVKINAALAVATTMQVATEDVEAVGAEITTARKLLGQIGRAA